MVASLTRVPRLTALAAMCVLLAMASVNTTHAQPHRSPAASEDAVRAAILLKVARFVEWPATTAGRNEPFLICIVGHEVPLRPYQSLEARQIGSRAIAVRRITGDTLDIQRCHLAYFPAPSSADVDYALQKLDGLPVLTIGESEAFAQRGGSMALVTREQRVTFIVNLQSARRSRLVISSQLLQLARIIE